MVGTDTDAGHVIMMVDAREMLSDLQSCAACYFRARGLKGISVTHWESFMHVSQHTCPCPTHDTALMVLHTNTQLIPLPSYLIPARMVLSLSLSLSLSTSTSIPLHPFHHLSHSSPPPLPEGYAPLRSVGRFGCHSAPRSGISRVMVCPNEGDRW